MIACKSLRAKHDFMDSTKIPFFIKLSLLSVGVFALFSMLYIGRNIIIPIVLSTIIAVVLSPSVDFLVRTKINRVLSIFIVVALLVLIGSLLLLLIASRLSDFSETFPVMMDKFIDIVDNTVKWLSQHFKIRTRIINRFIEDTEAVIVNSSREELGSTLVSMGSTLITIALVPVYVFMILFYKPLLIEFFRKAYGKGNKHHANEILSSSKTIIQSYLIGLLLQAGIIAVMYTVALFALGIKYAIILGIVGALLNMIPYLGGVIAMTLFVIAALVTKESSLFVLYIVGIYSVIQFIDNNFLVPKMIGSKVKINALVAIIAVIIGGSLWGIAGMFLSLPLVAIAKVIFDRSEVLQPWGYLLGDTMPPITIFKIKREK